MRITLILTVWMILISSCCPKIIPSVVTETKIDTLWRSDTVRIAGDTVRFTVPLNKLCDSLLKAKTFRAEYKGERSKVTFIKERDTVRVEAVCDEQEHIIDSLYNVVSNTNTTVTNYVERCVSKWHEFFKWWFFGTAVIILLIIINKSK